MKFIAHHKDPTGKHSIVEFDVPQAVLEATSNDPNTLSYNELINIAGHYYTNYVNFESCVGPYEWCIWPANINVPSSKLLNQIHDLNNFVMLVQLSAPDSNSITELMLAIDASMDGLDVNLAPSFDTIIKIRTYLASIKDAAKKLS
jgi:hypothetical protein